MSYTLLDTILYVENLSVVYDDKVIIKDITFTEKDVYRNNETTGQIIAFLGRSGRGKSTLFRALTGLIKPVQGKVLIRDLEKSTSTEVLAKIVEEGDVGFVDQKYTLFRNKTVYQALKFALRKSKLSDKEKNDKIDYYLNEWGLDKVRNQYPNELSGGQKQRTAIIEQIFCSGNYIILDEPFSGLDVGNVENVKKSINRISADHTLNTIIFSTHDIELAVSLADSIYVVGYPTVEGKLQNYGTIVGHFDLKQMNMAWKNYGTQHIELVEKIKQLILST